MRSLSAGLTIAALLSVVASTQLLAARPTTNAPEQTVDVSLPSGTTSFPAGPGMELANAHCVICHSAGMVTRQPPLSFDEWKAEVTKMRVTYGAPLPADKIEEIARYLTTINGKP